MGEKSLQTEQVTLPMEKPIFVAFIAKLTKVFYSSLRRKRLCWNLKSH